MNETNRSALWAAMMGTLGASLVASGACGQAASPVDAAADASAVDSRPAADAPPIPLAGPQVYWTDKARATIERYAVDVDATAAVLQASDGLVDPRGIATDRASGALYWADRGTGCIHRARLDGADSMCLVSGLQEPGDIALVAGFLYWAEQGPGVLRRASVAEPAQVTTVLDGVTAPYYLAVDADNGHIYWSEIDSSVVHRAQLDLASGVASGPEQPLTGLERVRDLEVDAVGGWLYISDRDASKVQRAPLANLEQVEDLYIDGLDRPHGLALDVAGDALYWTDTRTGDVRAGSLDGSRELTILADGLSEPWAIVFTAGLD